ncbi:MAG: ABC transporter substrate-binding protein [Chloroflexi bacterium]|nr:ABC transporter substrate-binding protein [Chloroflexota bacterium]
MYRPIVIWMSALTLLAACAPAPIPAAAPTTAAQPAAAAPKPAAPAATAKPAALAESAPRYGGTLNITNYADLVSFDPIQESAVNSLAPVLPNYSGILQHDPTEQSKVIGDLAERWEMSPDGKSYTFHLYKNVKWHDGTLFTAEDARFALEITRKPPRGITSFKQDYLKPIDQMETPDKDTLKITLQYPSASFLHNLGDGRMVIIPKHVFDAKGNMRRDIVGTGPYKFKVYVPGTSFSVVKNPDYFMKGRPYVDGITWYVLPDVATRFAALRTRRVHVTPFGFQGLTPSQSEMVRREMGEKISVLKYTAPTAQVLWMLNTKPPWNDLRVRRAVDLAIDRASIIKVAPEGVGAVGSFMPPGEWGLPEGELLKLPGYRQPKDADIAEARRLMAEAGYAQGMKVPALSRDVPQIQRAAVAAKEQLAQIGIELTITLRDIGSLFDLLYKRNFDIAFQGASAAFADPDQIFSGNFARGVPRNFGDFYDEKVTAWYEEQDRILDVAKRREVVLNMQRRMHELSPYVVLYWAVYELGFWKEVRNLKDASTYNNMKFQDVWLAQ